MAETTVNALTPECLTIVFRHLNPTQLGTVSCVQRIWKDHLLRDDSIWRSVCESRLAMRSGPETLDRKPMESFRAAWLAWQAALGKYGELGIRAYRAWKLIEDWTLEHIPEVTASLRPGASEEALDRAEQELGVRFPPALRVLYRIHDGQQLDFDAGVDAQRTTMHPSIFHGLFGGYAFYSHVVSCRMLPLRRLLLWTGRLRERLGVAHSSVLFAASFNFNKMVYCDVGSGGVKIPCVDKQACLDAVPPSQDGGSDGVLLWFEAYADALASGRFGVEPLDPEVSDSAAITLFPRLPPWRSEAVTRGVRVAALPVFIPEQSVLEEGEGGQNQYFFAYSVRFSLLGEASQAAAWPATAGAFRPLASVQLRSRHWVIRDGRGEVDSEVRGEAVVGHYPLLIAGGEEFVYQSCTHQRGGAGSMEGDFTFVEGSLQHPAGPEFQAVCAPFRLDVPDVVF